MSVRLVCQSIGSLCHALRGKWPPVIDKSKSKWLGEIYTRGGHGVAKSMENAVFWYRKAAENGSLFGQFNLGVCYYEGHGVTKSLTVARYWYQTSADQDQTGMPSLFRF